MTAKLWIPADRFLTVIERSGVDVRAELGEVGARRINELRSGRQGYVSLDTADRLLTALGLNDWFRIRREDGGLADIYVDEIQYGEPNHLASRTKPRKTTRKYATEEERQAARRETFRAAYERRKARRRAAAA